MDVPLSDLTDTLMKNCIRLNGGSLIVLADSHNILDIGRSIIDSAQRNTVHNFDAMLIDVDGYRKGHPLTSMPAEWITKFDEIFDPNNKENNALVYLQQSLDGEMPMRKELMNYMKDKGKLGGLPGCTYNVLLAGLHPENSPAFGEELHDFMSKENHVLLTSRGGTDLDLEFDHSAYKAINSNGVLAVGAYRNPIMGEVYLHPATADGIVVISGSYGPLMGHPDYVGNFEKLVNDLKKDPIVWDVREGRVCDVCCDNPVIRDFVSKEVFEKDSESGMRIGEFGLPTNLYVLKRNITGNLLIDEKGRVHVAHGHGYPTMTGAKYDTSVHGDGLIEDASIYSYRTKKHMMLNNKYNSALFKSLTHD